jgi:hypothetical protein
MTDADALRGRLRELHLRRLSGDLHERNYQRESGPLALELGRLVARRHLVSLGEPEEILAEHHVVQAHTRLTGAVLKESVQEATSLYAGHGRLVRVRSRLLDDGPISCDERDGTAVDSAAYRSIRRLRRRWQARRGEAAVGLGICALALLTWRLLSVTGPALLLVGLLGVGHALLMPTRWLEAEPRGAGSAATAPTGDTIRILALRQRSARALARVVRDKIAESRT